MRCVDEVQAVMGIENCVRYQDKYDRCVLKIPP